MSTQRATSGGVKSLRAMFESSKPDSQPGSPELRGRSPVESARSSESNPRPSSKIRASFVPVEPPVFADDAVEDEPLDPQATNAQASEQDSTIAHRRGSFSLDAQRDSEVLDELKSSVSEEREQRRQSVDIQETIPEQAVMTGPTNTPFPEIKEEDAMGSFVNNDANKLQDPSLSNSAGPKEEATQENADNAVREAARSLEKIEQDTGRKSEPIEAEAVPQQDLTVHATEQHSNQPDKVVSAVEDNDATMKPADPKEEATVSGGRALPNPHEQLLSLAGKPTQKPAEPAQPLAEPAQPPAEPAQPPAEPAQPAAAEEPAPEPAKPTLEPSPLIESSADKANGAAESEQEPAAEPAEAKPALSETNVEKSPAPSKTPTSVASPAKSASSKTASKEPAKKASRTSLHSQTSTSAPASKTRSTSRPAADRKPVHPSPPVSKPKAKSPTRPSKVPSHLMAPTAASAAKREADKAAAEKAAAPRKTTTTPRAPSVASKTTAASATKTAKPAAGRASLDSATRPTASSVHKRPESRTSASGGRRTSAAPKAADEGFLARMMRPTAASASKTHDKKEPEVKSPPRRSVSNPTRKPNGTSLAERGKKAVQKVVPGAGKKDEAKHEEPEQKSEPEPEPQPEPQPEDAPAAEEPAPEPEHEQHPEPIPEEPATEASEPPKDAVTTEEGQSAPNEELTQTPAGISAAANEIH